LNGKRLLLFFFFSLADELNRKIRDNFKILLSQSRVLSYITLLREGIWPDGKLKSTGVPRSAEEKIRTRDEANRKLSSLVPGTYLLLCNPNLTFLIFCSRSCGEYDRSNQCSSRCSQNICCSSKSTSKSTHSLYHH
jgi:hypothetical protein